MKIDINRFKETFFQEADEHVAAMESGLLALEAGAADQEALNATFRAIHSIKGSAGLFDLEALGLFAHAVETLLDQLRAGAVPADQERLELLLESVDVLRGLLAAARRGEPGPPEDTAALRARMEVAARGSEGPRQVSGNPGPAALEPAAGVPLSLDLTVWKIRFSPYPELFASGMDPLLVLRELIHLGQLRSIVVDRTTLPPLAELDPSECRIGWEIELATAASRQDIADVFTFVEDTATISIEALPDAGTGSPSLVVSNETTADTRTALRVSGGGTREESIRVSTRKVDKLIDLVGELVIAQSMTTAIVSAFTPADLDRLRESVSQLERYSRELQDHVMSVRMLPIGGVFGRLPRMVRDLAASLGKKVELHISGEDTELDKTVVEQLGDPLTHLVRNAIDHGLELPEQRRAAGKSETGIVEVIAYHEAGSVFVEVRDDGRGLDLDRIRRKAIERGLANESEPLSEEQIRQLIFHPGLSTAEQVSSVSGRGVGMDVVKRNVEALNGSVLLLPATGGAGTTVRIKLPLTLAILDGQCLRVGSETYILPLVSIIESIRPRPEQLTCAVGKAEMVLVRGEPVRLLRLHELFQISGETDPSRGLVVMVEHEGQRLALLVDELEAQTQVVVKSLETNFRKVEGFLGATILGTGRAALILDVAGIAAIAAREQPGQLAA
jgi:two-component system chemotaxis sensor kinase CheA